MKKEFNKIKLVIFASVAGFISTTNAQKIAAGGWHSLAICSDSTVKAFGENATGELGDGSTTDRNTPVSVKGLSRIIAVAGGGDQLEAHSMALRSDGTVWTWGSNLYGGLGDGTTNSTTEPVQTLLINDAIAISAGGWHSAALRKDSTVWVWGWNTDGQIGDGTKTDRSLPTKVSGLSSVMAIAAGTYHVLALKSDGTVWAWGDNVSGQIGDSSLTDRAAPVQVKGLKDVVKIAAGRFFSLALKKDGTVWTWGENLYGQLGNGTTNNSSVPVQVSGLSGITSAITATGAFHCIAVKNDNTVWAWGRNTYGNLGDGSTTHKSTPVQMTGVSNVAGLAAGTNFTLLYKTDGTFWGCGRNASGQLGDGTFLQRNTIAQSSSLCPIINVGIEDIVNNRFKELKVFPNPSSDGLFNISADFEWNSMSIEVFNLMGDKMDVPFNLTDKRVVLDLSSQAEGIYFLSVVSGTTSFYQKIVKR